MELGRYEAAGEAYAKMLSSAPTSPVTIALHGISSSTAMSTKPSP